MTAASGRMHAQRMVRSAHDALQHNRPVRCIGGWPFRSGVNTFRPVPPSTPPNSRGWRVSAEAAEGSDNGTMAASPTGLREQEPEDARTAIALGLRLHEAGQYNDALGMFQKALELPGTGIKRFRQVVLPTENAHPRPFLTDSNRLHTHLVHEDCCKCAALPVKTLHPSAALSHPAT